MAKYKINVKFRNGETVSQTVDNFEAEREKFTNFLCSSLGIPVTSLTEEDKEEIYKALRGLISGSQEVTIELSIDKSKSSQYSFDNLHDFLLHFLRKTEQRAFWIRHDSWEDIRLKLRQLLLDSNIFKKIVFWNTDRELRLELDESGNLNEERKKVDNYWKILNMIKTAKNTAFILDDLDVVIAAKSDYELIEQKQALKTIFEEKLLNENDSAMIIPVMATGKDEVPVILKGGYFQTFYETGKRFPILESLGRNLITEAAAGSITDVVGRDDDIHEIIRVLNQERNNNPILIGNPGVGKTAVVEGLAVKIHKREIEDERIAKRQIYEISYAALVQGTCSDEEVIDRIQRLLEEVRRNKEEVIVFIDEFHLLVEGGVGDRSLIGNILKPALARGDFPLIGATTEDEFRRFLGRDDALKERFGKIRINELPKDVVIEVFRFVVENYNRKHNRNISFTENALDTLYKLSKVLTPQYALPRSGLKILDKMLSNAEDRQKISSDQVKEEFALGKISSRLKDKDAYESLKNALKQEIAGQDEIIDKLLEELHYHFYDPALIKSPFAAFFMGVTGAGKNQLTKVLTQHLFGGEEHMQKISMHHVMEGFEGTGIMGSPPGYVGYEDGTPLLNFMGEHEYGIVLLDEFEKAGRNTQDKFLDILDDGQTTDNKGKHINCLPFIFIMSSNLGQDYDHDVDEDIKKQILLENGFKAEFINRIDILDIFKRFNLATAIKVIELKISEFNKKTSQNLTIDLTQSAKKHIADQANYQQFGARDIEKTFSKIIIRAIEETGIQDGSYVLDYKEEQKAFVAKEIK